MLDETIDTLTTVSKDIHMEANRLSHLSYSRAVRLHKLANTIEDCIGELNVIDYNKGDGTHETGDHEK